MSKDLNCLECGETIHLGKDVENREVISCPVCGAEFEVKKSRKGKVYLLTIDIVGEDWGE